MMKEFKKRLIVDGPESPNLEHFKTARLHHVPMYNSFYFFHIENMQEFIQGGKANLTQVGPFVYREYKQRFNITWGEVARDDNSTAMDQTIRFYEWRYYTYDAELSCDTCHEDMNITTLNLPLMVVLGQIQNALPWDMRSNFWVQLGSAFLGALSDEPLVFTKTAKELIWGYDDPLIALLAPFSPGAPSRYPGLMQNETSPQQCRPPTVWKTGKPDINVIKQYVRWRDQEELDVWNGTYANKVQGTDGTQFHPNVQPDDEVKVWVDTLHRMAPVRFASKTTVHGIHLWRMELPDIVLQNASVVPINAGWYANGPYGMFNETSALYKAPIFASKPAFLDADPVYRSAVHMMEPNRALHDTHIDVEPNSGTVMNARQRLQVSIKVSPMFGEYAHITSAAVPVTWIEQRSEITPDLAKQIRGELNAAIDAKDGMRLGGLIGGSLCIVLGSVIITLLYRRRNALARQAQQKTSQGLDYGSINYREHNPAQQGEEDDDHDRARRRYSLYNDK
eukprot:TRINITY_DN3567_c0_g1_i1.p1 TRINITY_DN3567_c0_g1~~TRINITY_DN3567_c0_g1_i1.p1  ORF type:complete len:507 (+),score=91.60 TRINITY_DN3567_c0_g1_i1:358-1878(+)